MNEVEDKIKARLGDEPEIRCEVPYERKDEFKINIPMSEWDDDTKEWVVPLTYMPELNNMVGVDIEKKVAKAYNRRHDKNTYRMEKPIKGIDADLFSHQKDAVGEMLNKKRYLLALDMGTGKTLSTIASFKELQNQDKLSGNKQMLVVCPSTLKRSWKDEIEKFTDISYTVIDGKPEEREAQWKEDTDIKIMNYALLLHDNEPLQDEWGVVALDEASFIKNADSDRTRKAKLLKSDYRFALTGTPVENDLTDIYNIMKFLDPYYFTNKYMFEERYLKKQTVNMGDREFDKIVGHKNVDELNSKIKPNMLRIKKEDLEEELPPISEKTIHVEMSDHQEKAYKILEDKFDEAVEEDEPHIGAWVQYLHMVCDSTVLLNEASKNSDLIDFQLPAESPKVDALEDILEKVENSGSKALVFTKWKTMAEEISENLEIDHVMLHGEHNKKEREKGLDEFENKKSAMVCTNIFSHGSNLQFADYVIHFDQDWNPAVEDQKTDRVHRFGQDKPVIKMDIVTSDTIEDNIREKKVEKRELFEQAIEKPSDLDKDELKDLV